MHWVFVYADIEFSPSIISDPFLCYFVYWMCATMATRKYGHLTFVFCKFIAFTVFFCSNKASLFVSTELNN